MMSILKDFVKLICGNFDNSEQLKELNNKNIFEGIVSRTKIYLIVIAVLLIIICTLKPKAIPISIAIYIIILLDEF